MTTKADDFALFVAVLAEALKGPEANPAATANLALAFRRLARTLTRYAVKDCNIGLTEADKVRQRRAERAAAGLATAAGLTAKVGGDPRGYCFRLVLPTGRYNTWGGAEEGWGVPT